jgi:hypothetical protein
MHRPWRCVNQIASVPDAMTLGVNRAAIENHAGSENRAVASAIHAETRHGNPSVNSEGHAMNPNPLANAKSLPHSRTISMIAMTKGSAAAPTTTGLIAANAVVAATAAVEAVASVAGETALPAALAQAVPVLRFRTCSNVARK